MEKEDRKEKVEDIVIYHYLHDDGFNFMEDLSGREPFQDKSLSFVKRAAVALCTKFHEVAFKVTIDGESGLVKNIELAE